MKKLFMFLIIGTIMMAFNIPGWAQTVAPYHALDTVMLALSPGGQVTSAWAVGNADTATIRVVLLHDTTTGAGYFQYMCQDPTTGLGIYLGYDNANSLETTYPGLATNGVMSTALRRGTYLQLQGQVTTNYGDVVFKCDTTVPAVILGTNYATPTTVLPNLAAFDSFDSTYQTGNESISNHLVRVNNVWFVPPYSTKTATSTWYLVDASLPLITSTYSVNSVNVTWGAPTFWLFDTPGLGLYSTLTLGQSFPAAPNGAFGPLDFVGIAYSCGNTQTGSNTPFGNNGFYKIQARGLQSDFIPHYFVTPGIAYAHPGGSSQQLIVAGGFPPYTWSLSTSTSDQGSLNTTSGATVTYSPGSTAGVLQVIVTDSAGEQIAIPVSVVATSAPLAPDISMDSMAIPGKNVSAVIKPSE